MAPNAPAPVAAAVERKRRRESRKPVVREILVVMRASLIGRQDELTASDRPGKIL
jgi:hypothetical protein